jgi:hypothetical protein
LQFNTLAQVCISAFKIISSQLSTEARLIDIGLYFRSYTIRVVL